MLIAIYWYGGDNESAAQDVMRTKTTSEDWKMLVFAVMSSPAESRNSTLGHAIATPTKHGIGNMHLYAPTPAGAQFVSIPHLTLIGYLWAASLCGN